MLSYYPDKTYLRDVFLGNICIYMCVCVYIYISVTDIHIKESPT